MAATLKKARVLSPIQVNGEILKPNSVIEGTAQQIKSFGGSVDASKEAVNYCIENFDVEPIGLVVDEVDETDPDETDQDDSDPDETDPDETDQDDSDPDETDPVDSGSGENQDGDDSTGSSE